MSLRITSSTRKENNVPSEKDHHTRVELWKDKIYFLTNDQWANDGSFYWPKPNRYAELVNSFRQEFSKQQENTLVLQEERQKIWPTWTKVCQWLKDKLDNLVENDPLKGSIDALVLVFKKSSLDQQIKVWGEFVAKNNTLPEITELTAWHQELKEKWEKSKYTSNICFVEEETGSYLRFVFQVPDRDFNKLDNFFFFRNNTFYEVSNWIRINHQNVIIECERSNFWNDFGKNFNGGFAGVIESSPTLNLRSEQCACPPFVESTHFYEFEFSWQPSYSLWKLVNPMGEATTFAIQGKDLDGNTKDKDGKPIYLGTAFINHDLEKIPNPEDGIDPKWFSDTIFYLLPENYCRNQEKSIGGGTYREVISSKETEPKENYGVWTSPLGQIKRKSIRNSEKEYETLDEFLEKGFKLKIAGKEEAINLKDPEYKHLHDHIGVQFFFNDDVVGPYPLSHVDLGNIEINITANPAGIIYAFSSKSINFDFKESTKLIMEASRIAKAGFEIGQLFLDNAEGFGEAVSWIPIPGFSTLGGILKKFGSTTSKLSKLSDASASVISSFQRTNESNTKDSKKGLDEREGERKYKMVGGINIPGKRGRRKGSKAVPLPNQNSKSPIRNRIGNTIRSINSDSTNVSYSYNPAKTVSATLGSIPSMVAKPTLENDYSLLDFLLHKKSPAFKMRFNVNKPIFEHYANNKKLLKRDGHELVNTPNFYTIINKAGFYRLTTHMMENDRWNFFKDAFEQGRHLYDTDPKEIWQLGLGKIEMPISNMIIPKLMGLETNVEEETNEISSADDESKNDGYAFLNYISSLRAEGETDEQGRKRFRELVDSLPASGAKWNTFICDKHDGKPMHECIRSSNEHPLYKFEGVKDTINNLGHSIDLFTTNKDLFKPITEYLRLNASYYRRNYTPEKIEWHHHARDNGYDTYYGYYRPEKYSEENLARERANEMRSESDNYRNVQVHRMDNLTEILTRCETIPENEVSLSTYHSRGKDKNWVTNTSYEYIPGKEIPSQTKFYKGGVEITWEQAQQARGNFKTVTIPGKTIKAASSVSKYYAKRITSTKKLPTKWWVSFEKKYKTERTAGSWQTISENEYNNGQTNPNPDIEYKVAYPDKELVYSLLNPPSWKFEHTFNAMSKRITLDTNKKYHGEIYTYKQGKGRTVKDNPESDDGKPWECWLEKRGNSFALKFNRVKIIGIHSGNIDDLGKGVEFVDERETMEEIKIDQISPEALNSGQTQSTAEEIKEENLTLEELLEKLGHLEQTPAEELTEEQTRKREEEKSRVEKSIKEIQSKKNKTGYTEDIGKDQNQRNRNK